ncbi:MarR family winged helix-turn-helix transcriptional regulator [Reinekea sp.]|uniref:MarR family winged helix-turn-helix transcriptional regulator n=1 Tax=Reinekea sp. TaxID=1970455 RepID=UPI0039890F8E
MSEYAQLKLENQICHSLYSATNALIRAYRPLLEVLDLTYPQYLVMLALWDEDNVMIKRLVERTRFDAGTLTPILKRLEQKNIIVRQTSAVDSRQKVIIVTGNGRALEAQAASVPEALACKIKFSEEEAVMLKQLTEKLYSAI